MRVGVSSTSRLLFQALPLVGEILRRGSASARSPACLRIRASGAKPVCRLSTVIGNLPISDSENEGMGSKIAVPLSRASASWPFTQLGPSGCFGGIPTARQFGRRKLLIFCLQFNYCNEPRLFSFSKVKFLRLIPGSRAVIARAHRAAA